MNIRLTASLMMLIAAFPTAQAKAQSDNTEAARNTEMILLGSHMWGGGIDTRRPGCGRCDVASYGFIFVGREGNLSADIIFTRGKAPYDAYNKGIRFKGDTKSNDMARSAVFVFPNGDFSITNSHWDAKCHLASQSSADCIRIQPDGYSVKFNIRILASDDAPLSTDGDWFK